VNVLMVPIYVLKDGGLAVPYGSEWPWQKRMVCQVDGGWVKEILKSELKRENIVGYLEGL